METSETVIVRARKEHRCYWCGEAILKGTSYARWACFDNGTASSSKTHGECVAAWNEGLINDRDYYSEMVSEAEHCRGCTCERGNCRCEQEVQLAYRDDDGILKMDVYNPKANEIFFVVFLRGLNIWAVDSDRNVYNTEITKASHQSGLLITEMKITDRQITFIAVSRALWILDKYLETVEV